MDEKNEWQDFSISRPQRSCILWAKQSDGTVSKCYYHKDNLAIAMRWGQKECYFQRKEDREPLYDVTHWKRAFELRPDGTLKAMGVKDE